MTCSFIIAHKYPQAILSSFATVSSPFAHYCCAFSDNGLHCKDKRAKDKIDKSALSKPSVTWACDIISLILDISVTENVSSVKCKNLAQLTSLGLFWVTVTVISLDVSTSSKKHGHTPTQIGYTYFSFLNQSPMEIFQR